MNFFHKDLAKDAATVLNEYKIGGLVTFEIEK